jgi:hypothetical protein
MTALGKFALVLKPHTDGAGGQYIDHTGPEWDPRSFNGDPRWPTHCTTCNEPVPEHAERQVFGEAIYLDDEGREHSIRHPTPGMMWDAWWSPARWKGPDGMSLHVCCPDGHTWCIDSQASNCDKKDDVGEFASSHRCWVRHGTPPMITVDKRGRTCGAGAGSIQTPGYHGHLTNGVFNP